MKYFIFVLSYFILIFNTLYAQPPLKFTRYTTNQGLVNNDVLCVCQDKFGFIWFGTKSGCSRFDGMEFKNYSYNPDVPGSIIDGWVNSIVLDQNSQLWFGLGEGIMIFDYATEQFKEILFKKSLNEEALPLNCFNLFLDSSGYLWVSSINSMVYAINTADYTIAKQINISGKQTIDFTEDQMGKKWIGTIQNGLLNYNIKSNNFIQFKHEKDIPQSLSSNRIRCLYKDSQGDLWIGTWGGGLNKFIKNTGSPGKVQFQTYQHNEKNASSLPNDFVYSIIEDPKNNFWVGTLKGLGYLDVNTSSFSNYYYDDRDYESINDNIIRSLYYDNSGTLWIATVMGVAKLKNERFKNFRYSSYKNSIRSNKAQCIFVDDNQDIYIGTPLGIDIFNHEQNKFQVFSDINKGDSTISSHPIVIHKDENKNLWIGTWDGGLNLYNAATKKYTYYLQNKNKEESQRLLRIITLEDDNNNNLWIGTWGMGLKIFDKQKNESIDITINKENSLCSNFVSCIVRDSKNNLWIGTRNGLNLSEPENPFHFKQYLYGQNGLHPKGYSEIQCIHEGVFPFLWIGARFGMHRLNRETGEIITFTGQHGLPSPSVTSIQQDNKHNLWVSTGNGLAKISLVQGADVNQNSTSNYKIKTFRKEDGLQNKYLERSYAKMKDGTMIFGGDDGFSVFHPDDIQEDTIVPRVVFTNFQIANKPVDIGKKINGQMVLKRSLQYTDTLLLNYKNNNITIEFAGLYYTHPETYSYSYKLEGFDEQWNTTGAQNRKATYTNLPYSTFTLFVKASNHDGVWNNEPTSLTIRISPPWWLTLWFKICCIILIIASILLWIKIRTNSLKKQKQHLEKEVEQRTAELKIMNQMLNERKEELEQQADTMAEMNKTLVDTNTDLEAKTKEVELMANKIHEADQKQLRFFANISHEFRTPLSLIIGPLEKLIENKTHVSLNKPEGYFILMHRNAQRLLRLINQIIDFRKIDQGEKKLHISNNNIIEFIREIKDAFSVQAEAKGIRLEVMSEELRVNSEESKLKKGELRVNSLEKSPLFTHHSSLITQFWFDPDIMEKILFNIISNAIKFTPEGGKISISIGIVETRLIASLRYQFAIKISDTGIGIKPENLNKIFDRFYRIQSDERYSKEGTGIGLSYTKELVELHNGEITVESEPGKGTAFTVTFPFHQKEKTIETKNSSINLNYTRSMISGEEQSKTGKQVISGKSVEEHPKSILLVEDNADLRGFIKNELKGQYSVYEAENGHEGWEMAFQIQPDLIISDIMMPVMDGIELSKRIKSDENTCHIALILLTAKTGELNMIEGLETGVDDYITKPFNINILQAKIKNIFKNRENIYKRFFISPVASIDDITAIPIDRDFLHTAIQIVEDHIEDPEFSNDDFIQACRLSKPTVYKKIKTLTNLSVSEFIRSIRLKNAAKLLTTKDHTISEVAYMVGFKEHSNFTRYFSQMFGKTPSEFKGNK